MTPTTKREKANAHRAVFVAIKKGKLQKKPCRDCGSEKVDAHHTDYSKPLDVVWLCRKHHFREHHRPSSSVPKRTMTFRVKASILERLRTSAKRSGLSMSRLFVRALTEAIDRHFAGRESELPELYRREAAR